MDDSDRATAQEELTRAVEIAVRKHVPELESGRCSYCGEATPGRWCDASCRDMWQLEQDANGRNGQGWPAFT